MCAAESAVEGCVGRLPVSAKEPAVGVVVVPELVLPSRRGRIMELQDSIGVVVVAVLRAVHRAEILARRNREELQLQVDAFGR